MRGRYMPGDLPVEVAWIGSAGDDIGVDGSRACTDPMSASTDVVRQLVAMAPGEPDLVDVCREVNRQAGETPCRVERNTETGT